MIDVLITSPHLTPPVFGHLMYIRLISSHLSSLSVSSRSPHRGARSARRHLALVFSALMVVFTLSSGCSAPPKNQVIPGPPIRGLNLTGGYDCVQFGFMKLKQSNNVVRGTYEGVRGGDGGTLVGKIEGDIVWVDWVNPGSMEHAQLPQKGRGWLRVSQRGQKLVGKWGHDMSRDDGGSWVADRSEFYE